MIVEELLESVAADLKVRTATEVRVGLAYTVVKLDDGSCGLAATIREEPSACCILLREAGELAPRPAAALAELALSTDGLEAAIGVATINAVLNGRPLAGEREGGDLVEEMAITTSDSVGMIGYFGPLVEPIRRSCRELLIFERRAGQIPLPEGVKVYPDWAAELLLPQCDAVLISGSTVVNKTIDHLLELCRGRVGLVGPTTPLSPVFARHGVSFLFGSRVRDAAKILKIVSEGGGTPAFGSAIIKVAVRLNPHRRPEAR